MASIGNNDIAQVTMIGKHAGQYVLSVFHYQYEGPAVGADQYQAVLAALSNDFYQRVWLAAGGMRSCVAPQYYLQRIRTQIVHTIRGYYVDQMVDSIGNAAGEPALPPNDSVCVSIFGEKVGRGRTGSKHFPAVPADWILSGTIDPDRIGTYVSAAQKFQLVLLGADPAQNFRPVIWNPRMPLERNRVRGIRVEETSRIMRRRTVGVGI